MTISVYENNEAIAKYIQERRKQLNLSIERASRIAKISTKTWCRYEAGESIRTDKVSGLLNALHIPNMQTLIRAAESTENISEDKQTPYVETISSLIEKYKDGKYWSDYIEKSYGPYAAFSLAEGIEILHSTLEDALEELKRKPKGTHIGEIYSTLTPKLPVQFLPYYDYDFIYYLLHKTRRFMKLLNEGHTFYAHSVAEAIILYMATKVANSDYFDCIRDDYTEKDKERSLDGTDYNWIYEMLSYMNLREYLYDNDTRLSYIPKGHPYHFNNWQKEQFHTETTNRDLIDLTEEEKQRINQRVQKTGEEKIKAMDEMLKITGLPSREKTLKNMENMKTLKTEFMGNTTIK